MLTAGCSSWYPAIYSNHMELVQTQLSREARPLPSLRIRRDVSSIFDFRFDDFEIVDYDRFAR